VHDARAVGHATVSYRFSDALQIVDYFLLNAVRLGIARYGLECLTDGEIRSLLQDLASSSRKNYSIYQWPERLTQFLKEKIVQLDDAISTKAQKDFPALAADIPPDDEKELGLSDDELVKARVWLWNNKYYKYSTDNHSTQAVQKFQLITVKLARLIYADTLRGCTPKPQIAELKLLPEERYKTEFQGVPVSNRTEDKVNVALLSRYCRVLSSLGQLGTIGLPVPTTALEAITNQQFKDSLSTKATERFKPLPPEVVFSALRGGIEFIIKYGDSIVDAALTTMVAIDQRPEQPDTRSPFLTKLPSKISKALLVERWSVVRYVQVVENNPKRKKYSAIDRRGIHSRIRSHEGLRELILVLYGAVQICVGTLMARRQGELMDLLAGHAIDITGEYLVFDNRKSGSLGIRETEARPIPQIGVRAIRMLERLQDGLVIAGIIEKRTNVFAYPKIDGSGLVEMCVATFNRALNVFADYAQLPLDSKGRRYYIRQHQLRGFFAMLFFWGESFGGMDVLRWFLGQLDAEHLYHYITTNTPGEILRGTKARYAVESIRRCGHDHSNALADFVSGHFGTKYFSVLDSEEVEEYVEDLLIEGKVSVEPEFFDSPHGRSYRIIVKVVTLESSNESRQAT